MYGGAYTADRAAALSGVPKSTVSSVLSDSRLAFAFWRVTTDSGLLRWQGVESVMEFLERNTELLNKRVSREA
jgi:GMP synthase PP-ATPase subunit